VLERIIMQSGHRMNPGKQRLLIIDDNPAFLDAFIERQGDYYEIETLESQAEVLRTLNRMDGEGVFPDIFLVDMYYPRGGPGSQELIDVANQRLREFAELEREIHDAVQQSYEPLGLSALKQIRKILSADELPVLVYTQSSLLTLGDQGIQEIERLGGGWLLKDRYDARTEQAMICGEIIRARRAQSGAGGAR
jgi:CheY-like chemotaxis protein